MIIKTIMIIAMVIASIYIYVIRGSPQLLRALKPEILERQVFDIGGLGCRATFRVPGWVM